MTRYVWILLVLVIAAGCATQSASVSGEWKTIAYEKNVSTRLVKGGNPETEISFQRVILGWEPALVFQCKSKWNAKVVASYESKKVRYRKHARATLVLRNAGNRNMLAYGAGWAVLAPFWMPTYYHFKARGAAKKALSNSTGRAITTVGKHDCVTETWYDIKGQNATPETLTEEKGVPSYSEPLADKDVTVVVGSRSWTATTDSEGVLLVPIRPLLDGFIEGTKLTCNVDGTRRAFDWTDWGLDAVLPQILAGLSQGPQILGPDASARLAAQVTGRTPVLPGQDMAALQKAIDNGQLPEIRTTILTALQNAPANAELWRLFAVAGKAERVPTLPESALSVACALAEPGSPSALEFDTTFGLWFADNEVDVYYAKNDKGKSELAAVRGLLTTDEMAKGSAVLSEYPNVGLKKATFGSLMLPRSVFLSSLEPSDISPDSDGRLRFWLFAR